MRSFMLRSLSQLNVREGQPCSHGILFDEVSARGLSSSEIRERWPRGSFSEQTPCVDCGYIGIAYASYKHYLAGDW